MERREHYRVSGDRLDEPSVIVVPTSGTPFKGELIDMSASGAGIRVNIGDSDELVAGERVVLVVGAHQFDTPLTVSAINRYKVEDDETCRCGFQFLDPQEFIQHLPAPLISLFDARNMIRVHPAKDEPIRITVSVAAHEGEADPAVAELADISGVGLSMELDVADAARISDKQHLALLIHLPNTPHALSMMGEVRHRLPLGDRWRLGVEFEPAKTESFEIQRQEIIAYVIQRQGQIEAEMTEQTE